MARAWRVFGIVAALPLSVVAQGNESAGSPPEDASRIEWVHEEGSFVELRLDGQQLWRFNFNAENTHNYFHPLCLPGVGELTVDAPGDHVHHHGLWFSWKYINGVNFWEHAPGRDRPDGRTSWPPPEIELGESGAATFRFQVSYSVFPTGSIALVEHRTISVSAPAHDGAFQIDWTARFEALAETVTLDRTPLPDEPGGRVYGGYAGLSARLSQWADRAAVTLEGQIEFNQDSRYRGRSDAFEYSGVLDGREIGIAILSHPENLNSPSPWYAIRTQVMSFFTPAVICYGPHEMQAGDEFTLRYRVIVHPGRWGAEALATAFEQFVTDRESKGPPTAESKEEPDDD